MFLNISKELPSSRREQVAHILRNAILNGNLKPGDRIREQEISESLGVSRGPIREAIRQLEQEGLLISYPYKETVVAAFSEEEIEAVFVPIRIILEKYSVEKACESLTDYDIKQLQFYVSNMIQAAQENDLAKVVENNLLFHQYLVTLSGSKSLELIWSSIMHRIRIHFYQLGKNLNINLVSHAKEHQELLDAIISKDTERSIELLKNHIR